MDETSRQLLLSDIARAIHRRGLADMTHEMAGEIFDTDLEIEQFAAKHQCSVCGHLSGGSVIFFHKTREP